MTILVHLRKFASELISFLGLRICVKLAKFCHRSELSVEHAQSLLMIGTTNFEPQLDVIFVSNA